MYFTTLLTQYPMSKYEKLKDSEKRVVSYACHTIVGKYFYGYENCSFYLADWLTDLHFMIEDDETIDPMLPACIAFLINISLSDDIDQVENSMRRYYGI